MSCNSWSETLGLAGSIEGVDAGRDDVSQNGLSEAVAAAGACELVEFLLDRFVFDVFFEVPDVLPCGSFVSTFDKRSRPLSTLCVNWLMKLWPSKRGTSRLKGGNKDTEGWV